MGRFDELRGRLPTNINVTRLSLAELDQLIRKYPQIPEDYVAFLADVGYGDLGEMQLHGGPSHPEAIYPRVSKNVEHVIIFGDDKQGYCFGFDRNDGYRVVEISPSGELDTGIESDFTSLMESYFQ